MRQLNLVIAVLMLATGCAAQQAAPPVPTPQPAACEGEHPVQPSWIKYGNAELSVKPNQNVHTKKYWRIHLQPHPQSGLDDALVFVTGKTPDALTWINASGRKSDSQYIVICVPEGTTVGDYYFSVTVVGVGTIDPRVRVEE